MLRDQRLMVAALLLCLACSWACAAKRAPVAPPPPDMDRLVEAQPGK
jgi:Spy/CpxP family protein refolding chaperone